MTVIEFAECYPQYSFDFAQPISQQPRLYDAALLATLPAELTPSHAYRGGGRGRPNLNQTRTHSQCKTCRRVLRNDFFYAPPSMVKQNVVYTHCLTCAQEHNAKRYDLNSLAIRSRRIAIWRYLAPRCLICGFDQHVSAMDMHHLAAKEAKETEITALITEVAYMPDAYGTERLLREVTACIPLCSNCHRMVHAGALQLPNGLRPLPYRLIDLMDLLKRAGQDDAKDHADDATEE
ncbi:MAG: hypothetical protein R3C14_34310 [Caldilineaceae bacterium]